MRYHRFRCTGMLDQLKCRACGCFVAGMRRGLRAKEPVLVENGAVYIHNFHLPVGRVVKG